MTNKGYEYPQHAAQHQPNSQNQCFLWLDRRFWYQRWTIQGKNCDVFGRNIHPFQELQSFLQRTQLWDERVIRGTTFQDSQFCTDCLRPP
ncbi:hypothetical protein SF06_34150 [Pseudomonas flexibilis]|nr:hypothetical protein SF06_34150 [Pseudomonas flexibilis]